MVSHLGENFSSHPAPVFVEFQYIAIYSKMFFQQEITGTKVSTLFVCRLLTAGTTINTTCSTHTAVTG